MTFRAHRYPTDFAAFDGVDLSPQGVIELDPMPLAACIPSWDGMDTFACDYDSTATESGPCNYLAADYGTHLEFLIGEVNLESGCNGGYAVAESLANHPSQCHRPPEWNGLSPTTWHKHSSTMVLVRWSPTSTTQTLSLCGSNMNVVDAAGNHSLTYDSLGYINPFYNGYLAPAQNFAYGCGFEFACNYDPCAIYDFELCESSDVSVETTTDDGSGNGSATASVEGGVEPYSYTWFEGLSENSFASTMSVDSLLAENTWFFKAVDSTGCIGSLDFVIDMVDAVEALDATWTVFPNPATDALQVQVTTPREGQLS